MYLVHCTPSCRDGIGVTFGTCVFGLEYSVLSLGSVLLPRPWLDFGYRAHPCVHAYSVSEGFISSGKDGGLLSESLGFLRCSVDIVLPRDLGFVGQRAVGCRFRPAELSLLVGAGYTVFCWYEVCCAIIL
jgi:hypothetical protein